MGIYLSIYETVGVVLDSDGLAAWRHKVAPEDDAYGEDLQDYIVGDFDGLGLLNAGGYDDHDDYFIYLRRLFQSHDGGKGGTGGVLGSGRVSGIITPQENSQLIALAAELGTTNQVVRSIVALDWS